jgi:hypothetical protein
MDAFFSWAFFAKLFSTLLEWERHELDRLCHELEKAHDLTFQPRVKNTFYFHSQPRCMSVEPVNCLYRPLLVCLIVDLVKLGGSLLLFAKGYQRVVASTGLVAWHRPAAAKNSSLMPLLFFHGIAPGGLLMLYLPMLFGAFANEPDRPVKEISKIRMVASSELFTEYYLRRHFSWYNSELWLGSVTDCELLVCLAEKDEIVNAGKVKREVERHSSGRLIFWTGAGHADCVTSPSKWKQVMNAMLEQELKIAQETR